MPMAFDERTDNGEPLRAKQGTLHKTHNGCIRGHVWLHLVSNALRDFGVHPVFTNDIPPQPQREVAAILRVATAKCTENAAYGLEMNTDQGVSLTLQTKFKAWQGEAFLQPRKMIVAHCAGGLVTKDPLGSGLSVALPLGFSSGWGSSTWHLKVLGD